MQTYVDILCKQMNKILFCKKMILLHISNIHVFMFAEM